MRKVLLFLALITFSIPALAADIHVAAEEGNLERVKELISENPNLINTPDEELGETPLLKAAHKGHADIVKFLTSQGADLKSVTNRQSTALHLAAASGDIETIKFIYGKGLSHLDTNASGNASLHLAAYHGSIDAVNFFLKAGSDIEVLNSGGNSALFMAVYGSNNETFKFLVKKGANVNIQNRWGSLLNAAANRGNIEMMDILLQKGIDIEGTGESGNTPLFSATYRADIEAVKYLIDKGANINIQNQWGSLMHASVYARSPEKIKLFHDLGIDINIPSENDEGGKPLHWAAYHGFPDIIQTLIDLGADINGVAYEDARLPIHQSAYNGRYGALKVLLDNGADPNSKTGEGATPILWLPSDSGLQIAELLIKHGADANISDTSGFRPIFGTAYRSNIDLARLFISNGADVNVKDQGGNSLLLNSSKNSNTEYIKLLLDSGAKVGITDTLFGRTELHWVSLKGRKDVAELLINNGANVNTKDKRGKSSIEYAAQYGHKEVADLLLANGAIGKDLRENYGFTPLLDKSLSDNEAAIWYMDHSGWAVKTKNNLLIFDYWEREAKPTTKLLANGHIDPDEIKNQKVTVFVSHAHGDHYDTTIFNWMENVSDITYVLGMQVDNAPSHEYLPPHEIRNINGIEIQTLASNDTGVGFMIKVDGLTIFHAGDHACRDTSATAPYSTEIDYIAETNSDIDIAFLPICGCGFNDMESVYNGTYYTLEKLSPEIMFPMHGGGREHTYKEFADDAKQKGVMIPIGCVENRGDHIHYKNGILVEIDGLTL